MSGAIEHAYVNIQQQFPARSLSYTALLGALCGLHCVIACHTSSRLSTDIVAMNRYIAARPRSDYWFWIYYRRKPEYRCIVNVRAHSPHYDAELLAVLGDWPVVYCINSMLTPRDT